jgi:hypothetical protein
VTRRVLAATALLLLMLLPLGPVTSAGADDDNCSRQSRRVRLPDGFAEARVSFAGVLANGRNRTGETFPGAALRELRVVVDWSELEKMHHQRIELSSPDGQLYQRFATTFNGTGRTVSTSTRLPVTGSAITDSGLYGEWCAEVFLDDEDAPIARRRFILTAP